MLLIRQVKGLSMLPSLREDRLVVAHKKAPYQVGDVVVISHEGLEKIKRISAVTDDMVYVTGDNKQASTDSRHFGWLSMESIKGKVIWPRITRHMSRE